MLVAGIALVTCIGCAEADVTIDTRIHGVLADRAEPLEDAAVIRWSASGSRQCVDLEVATLTSRGESTTSGGRFCGARPSKNDAWYGISGRSYVPPSYDGLDDRGERIWGDLIYGIGPPDLEAIKVTDGDIEVVVDTDEGDGMTAFVVWWRGSGNPGGVVPDYRVQPSS